MCGRTHYGRRSARPAFWACISPKPNGGGGGGLADYNLIAEEVAAHGCPLLTMVINSICAPIIAAHGSEELKRDWLPGLASGERRMAFAITEPDAGTNTHKVTTTARETAGGWVINGAKYWTSAIDESETAGTVVTLGPEDHDPDGPFAERLQACGRPMPWVELKLIDPATGRTVDVGDVGEIRLRSRAIMQGYWRNPAETSANITPDGWLCTGDAAVLDADGYVYLRDRYKDMIVSGGENIYPVEIDNVLQHHPANSGASSARIYWESYHGAFGARRISLPVACTIFPKDIYQAPRSWAEACFEKLFYWSEVEKGGHFAAFEQPVLFVSELRKAFAPLRGIVGQFDVGCSKS